MKAWLIPLLIGTATLSWIPPTENSDGSALTDLAGYNIVYGASAEVLNNVVRLEVPQASAWTLNLPAGMYYFGIKAFNSDGTESALSNVVSKLVTDEPQTMTVYTVVKQNNRFVMIPVGTAPANTECDRSQSVNGYYVVPREVVTWSGTVKPAVVVAPGC